MRLAPIIYYGILRPMESRPEIVQHRDMEALWQKAWRWIWGK